MPYISKERRAALFNESVTDRNSNIETPGELNYMITTMIMDYCKHKGLNYQTISDIIGALEGSKLEFYRKIVVSYENGKCRQNGDVY